MTSFVSSRGKDPGDVLDAAAERGATEDAHVRVTIRGFQALHDSHGHVIALELPGRICGALREAAGCRWAEVLRTPHGADAVILAAFSTPAASQDATRALARRVFQLEHLRLPCPPLDVARGDLDALLGGSDGRAGPRSL